jgi:hypothetical protein
MKIKHQIKRVISEFPYKIPKIIKGCGLNAGNVLTTSPIAPKRIMRIRWRFTGIVVIIITEDIKGSQQFN